MILELEITIEDQRVEFERRMEQQRIDLEARLEELGCAGFRIFLDTGDPSCFRLTLVHRVTSVISAIPLCALCLCSCETSKSRPVLLLTLLHADANLLYAQLQLSSYGRAVQDVGFTEI